MLNDFLFRVEEIDFNDGYFLEDFEAYCLRSMPDETMESKSLNLRIKFARIYLNQLKKTKYKYLARSKDGQNMGYIFLSEKEKGVFLINFLFPSQKFKFKTRKHLIKFFYESLITLSKMFDIKTFKGEVVRSRALSGYVYFIKRYAKCVNLEKKDDGKIYAHINIEDVYSEHERI